MTRRAPFLAAGALTLAFLPATFAQEVEVRASVDRNQVQEGDEVQFSILISGTSQQPDEPPTLSQVPGFTVAAGPAFSREFRWVNGQTSASRTYTWTLLPQGRGAHTIPPVAITLGGKVYRTAMLRVDVVAGGTQGGTGGSGPAPQPSPFADPRMRRRLASPPASQSSLFVEAQVDKTEVYPGEQVTLLYKVYTQYEIVQLSLQDQPTYQGFWAEDIKADDKWDARPVNRKEGSFMEYTVLKKALFPTSPGTLTIPSLTFHFVARRRGGDPFDSFFFQPTEGIFRSSQAVTLRVKELPEAGRPPEFNGAVGRFALSVKSDRSETKVNDAVGLKVVVEGQGNINTLGTPSLPALPDFKRYDPKVEESMQAKAGRLVGSKSWSYVLIPLAPGRQEIPPVRFAFFDSETAQYRVLESKAIHLDVARSETVEMPIQPIPARADIPVLGADIRYIKLAGGKLSDQGKAFYGSRLFFGLLLAPLLFNVGLLLVVRRQAKMAGSEARVRQRRARRAAKKRLSRARGHLSRDQSRVFYQELASALTTYLADKIGVPASGLTYDRIEELLQLRGVDPLVRGRFRRCLETCDFARFAPAASEPVEMERAFSEAASVVETLEGSVKVA